MKTHLRENKSLNQMPKCRTTSTIVAQQCYNPEKFKKVPSEDRCKRCENIFLKKCNEQRKKKDKNLYTSFTDIENRS